jgi:hypothetical protein
MVSSSKAALLAPDSTTKCHGCSSGTQTL